MSVIAEISDVPEEEIEATKSSQAISASETEADVAGEDLLEESKNEDIFELTADDIRELLLNMYGSKLERFCEMDPYRKVCDNKFWEDKIIKDFGRSNKHLDKKDNKTNYFLLNGVRYLAGEKLLECSDEIIRTYFITERNQTEINSAFDGFNNKRRAKGKLNPGEIRYTFLSSLPEGIDKDNVYGDIKSDIFTASLDYDTKICPFVIGGSDDLSRQLRMELDSMKDRYQLSIYPNEDGNVYTAVGGPTGETSKFVMTDLDRDFIKLFIADNYPLFSSDTLDMAEKEMKRIAFEMGNEIGLAVATIEEEIENCFQDCKAPAVADPFNLTLAEKAGGIKNFSRGGCLTATLQDKWIWMNRKYPAQSKDRMERKISLFLDKVNS